MVARPPNGRFALFLPVRIVKFAIAGVALGLLGVSALADVAPERTSTVHYLSDADRALYKRAFDAADKKNWADAQALAIQGHDATARRLIQWRYLLDPDSGAGFAEISGFMKNNPGWPLQGVLQSRAEQAMPDGMDAQSVIQWFNGRTPNTGIGKIRLGHAMIAAGQTTAGSALIRSAWAENSLQSDQEAYVIRNHGDLLTPDLEAERLNSLLWHDDVGGAKRELARAPDDAQRVAKVRLELRANSRKGIRLAEALPKRLAAYPGLMFDLASAYRDRDDTDKAADVLLKVATVENKKWPGKMWGALNVTARQAVNERKYRTAYRLVSDTGLTDGSSFADAEFFAGWIALHFLNDPKTALGHFQKLEAGVSRPISKSRAYFWEGRAAEADGDLALAAHYYQQAALISDTYYGQLAVTHISQTPILHLPDASVPAAVARDKIEDSEMVRAIRVLADLGQEHLLRLFANAYVGDVPDATKASRLAQLMVDLGYPEVAVRTAKQAGYGGVLLLNYSFPVMDVPPYQGQGAAPETPLVLALIRQETEFDPNAVSGAGALGIMQVMPDTGRKMAKIAGVDYSQASLLYDTKYNMQLGMGELQHQLDNWGGSYVLAIAAYNAGPSNVKRWLALFGDPRTPGIDPVDWVESIPFGETRNYVQRVIENIQIYRNRLAGADQPSRILADLYRPNPPQASVLKYTPPPMKALPPEPKKKTKTKKPAKHKKKHHAHSAASTPH
ncbi:MAG TPA: transglycosylase SLT domain-containing protein [Rhizomicrobium sp.]|nr:transglycosylase SLT domain-containing protein [Rhizomicrobium sp.]